MASVLDTLKGVLKKAVVLPGFSLQPFLTPPPRVSERVQGVAKSIGNFLAPETTKRITEAKTPAQRLAATGLVGPGLLQEVVVQPLARTFASLGLSATAQEKAATPKGKLQQFILGKEPVQPFHKTIQSGQALGEVATKRYFPNTPPEVGQIAGLFGASIIGGLELSAADIGLGGLTSKGEKKLLEITAKRIVEQSEEKVAKELVSSIGVKEARRIAERLAAEKATVSGGKKLVKAIEQLDAQAIREGELGLARTLERVGIPAEEAAAKATAEHAKTITGRIAAEAPTTKLVERGFITSAKEVLPEAADIAGYYTPRNTEILAQKAANLVKDNVVEAERLALTQTTQESVATASELLKHYAKLADNVKDEAAKTALYDKAAEIASSVAERLTEQGRVIQAASILGRLTPEGQVRFAAREIQKYNIAAERGVIKRRAIPELTGEQAKRITEEMKAIQKLPDGEEKAIKFQELQRSIQSIIPSTSLQKLSAIWQAGLLTGIRTSGLNIFANLAHAGSEIIKDVPAAGADTLLSLLTGKRTVVASIRGLPEGVKEGVQRGWRFLRTGYDARDIASKLDYHPVTFKHKMVQGYVDTVFRVLGAEDQPFYYGALNRSLTNQAMAEARNRGLKGAEKKAFIKRMIEQPSGSMSLYALIDAETAVFQNKTALGAAAHGIRSAIPGSVFAMPFTKTISAVAMQVIHYTPIGVVKEAARQIAAKKFDQRMLSKAIGRSTTGLIPLYLGAQLFKSDLISLDYPKTERERELWKAEGRKPNTVRVGNEWRSIATFGPVGNILLVGGQFEKALKDTGSPTEAMVVAIFGTIKSFTEQTFLKGVNDVLSAISDPQRSGKNVLSSFVSSWVPTIINDVARATDPKERRAETVLQRIQSRIPLLRQKLQPQVTIMGDELERIGNPLEVMLDPTRPSPANASPTIMELRRLMDSGYKVSPTMLGDKTGYKGLTQEQNTKLWKLAGIITNEKLTNLFATEAYQKATDDEKAKIVDRFVELSKLNARAGAVLSLTEGLQGEELKKKLSELKATGLMTKDVFKKYVELR